jgi:hypothetical protein
VNLYITNLKYSENTVCLSGYFGRQRVGGSNLRMSLSLVWSVEDSLMCSHESATEPHEFNPHKILESRNAYRMLIGWHNRYTIWCNTWLEKDGHKGNISAKDTKLNTAIFWTNKITEKEQELRFS